jgi:endonuclease III
VASCDEKASAKIAVIHRRLIEAFGEPDLHARNASSPVGTLVNTILSQNTSNVNRERAFRRLRERFPTWNQVRDAPVEELAEAIQPAGLSNQKAPRIQAALRRISDERGELSLGFLADMPLQQAREWLESLHGVGPKTAAIVLLFSLRRPAFPVDTHVHRVARRLGLIGPRVSAEQAHQLLEAQLPPEWYYPFHINVIQHGREICHARNPQCQVCMLRDVCDYYQAMVGTEQGS